jgi:formylglycine-generating enzyme required for sulfatase activity
MATTYLFILFFLNSFYIDKYEVTNALYKVCVDMGDCEPPKQIKSYTRSNYFGNTKFNNYPVIYVSWSMAKNYCEWRGVRLPTEAEWEKAASSTDERKYPWGNEQKDLACKLTNCGDTFDIGDTYEIGMYTDDVSPYGVFDMSGNVFEWVSSLNKPYPYDPNDGREDPTNTGRRVQRGGDTYSRSSGYPNSSFYGTGFRCARSAP